VNYQTADRAGAYADAWVVRNTRLARKHQAPHRFGAPHTAYPCTLAFVSGPNAACRQTPTGSTARTHNPHAEKDYTLFYDGVKAAVRAGLDALAHSGVTVALVPGVCTGMYAGPHRRRINADFEGLLQEVARAGGQAAGRVARGACEHVVAAARASPLGPPR
jgi:hypothetical protein